MTLLSGCATTGGGSDGKPDPSVTLSPEVQALAPAARRIIDAALAGNDAWSKIEHLALKIGPRLSGSKGLDRAIAWAMKALEADGQENVRAEPVMVPHWERGFESLKMVGPAQRWMPVLGLGGTVATPPGGITAEVEVVRSLADVTKLGEAARGKILLIDTPMAPHHPVRQRSGYGDTVKFRYAGPGWADQSGAVGVMMRSLTATSLATPHTGGTSYHKVKRKVPAVAVSTEDAAAMARLRATGETVKVTMVTSGKHHGFAPSANVVAELVGRDKPHEVVVIGGHLDAWDVGHGAHDDASGCVMAMEAINILRKLNLRPRRTIRVVLWTNEENGLRGARDYTFHHAEELKYHAAGLEADSGSWKPMGYRVEHKDKKVATEKMLPIAKQIVQLSASIGANRAKVSFSGADVKTALFDSGIPLFGHWMNTKRYFDIHHTHADTLDKLDKRELTENVASMAVMAYALAELPYRLDRAPMPAADVKARDLNELAWLAGDWQAARGGREVWTAPHAGTMIGLGFQNRKAGAKRERYERLRIARGADGKLVLYAHPKANKEPVAFTRVSGDANSVKFANPQHDFPKFIEYRRVKSQLVVVVGGDNGASSMSLNWRGNAKELKWLGR